MYTLSEQQIDHILKDIKFRGVEMEDLQLNLLDHICCIIESELDQGGNFESFYEKTIHRFFKKELKEIEEETILLLTFKNYYAMKKTMMISGAISVAAFIFGSFLKIMHWPGAGVMLVLGIVFSSLLFLPLMAILKNREIKERQDKLVVILGTAVGILYSNFVLFKVMHWPGANILLFSFISLAFFIFLPVYFFSGIRKPETKVNTITSSILLMMIIGLQFTLINVRPSRNLLQMKMYTYIHNEEILANMRHELNDTSAVPSESKKIAADINSKCEEIKSMILEKSIGITFIPKDFEDKNILLEESELGPGFYQNGNGIQEKGVQLMNELKKEIDTYNASAQENKLKIPVDHLDVSRLAAYSNYTLLEYLTQIQMYLA